MHVLSETKSVCKVSGLRGRLRKQGADSSKKPGLALKAERRQRDSKKDSIHAAAPYWPLRPPRGDQKERKIGRPPAVFLAIPASWLVTLKVQSVDRTHIGERNRNSCVHFAQHSCLFWGDQNTHAFLTTEHNPCNFNDFT